MHFLVLAVIVFASGCTSFDRSLLKSSNTDGSVTPVATCDDGVLSAGETDVDCGGPCAPCSDGRSCQAGPDCISRVCAELRCAVPSCVDGQRNGDELQVDCGGSNCGACIANALPMPTSLATKDRFGTRVALAGNHAVVGHYYDQTGGSLPPSEAEPSLGAYVLSHVSGQWQSPALVQGYAAPLTSWFGLGVGVGAQYAVIGAPLQNSGAPGFAGVFAPDASGSWNYCYKFADPEASVSNPFFGRSVVVRDPLVVVSAPMQQVQSAAGAGAVYVFTHDEAAACNTGWSRSNPIYAPTADLAESLGFGRMIALDATTMAVGTSKGETGVYLVQRQASWSVCNQIPAPPEVLGTPHTPGTPAQQFGYDIAFDNGLLAVTAVPYPAFTSTSPGRVYLYRVGADCAYQLIATLNEQTAPALALADRFGYSVGVSGPNVVVGAPGDRNAGVASGAAYVFSVGADNVVSYRGAIRGAPSFEGQAFGASVAIAGGRVIIGATGIDAALSVSHGGAHGFEF